MTVSRYRVNMANVSRMNSDIVFVNFVIMLLLVSQFIDCLCFPSAHFSWFGLFVGLLIRLLVSYSHTHRMLPHPIGY